MASDLLDNPFRGLEPFKAEENLYGRNSDFTLLSDRIYSRKTTLLFSASGAGKTSFLQAKVLRELKSTFHCCIHREWAGPKPKYALLENIAQVLESTPPLGHPSLTEYLLSFPELRRTTPERVRARILAPPAAAESSVTAHLQQEETALRNVLAEQLSTWEPEPPPKAFLLILDQFEEFFQAHGFSEDFDPLITELCDMINAPDLRIRIIISMRDDFLGDLGIFDNRIPDLFNNYYHLKSPSEAQAREIIRLTLAERPLALINEKRLPMLVVQLSSFGRFMLPSEERRRRPRSKIGNLLQGAALRPGRLYQAFKQTAIANWAIDRWNHFRKARPIRWSMHSWSSFKEAPVVGWASRRLNNLKRWFLGPPPSPGIKQVKRHTVVLPYLQIVCRELWERDCKAHRRPFQFLENWDPEKTTAQDILDDFCTQTLNQFSSERQKNLASRAFDYLMTREGAKQAYEYKTLAQHMGVDPDDLHEVLERLHKPHILREYTRLGGSSWYELYHDMYAVIVQQWKNTHEARRAHGRRITFGVVAGLLFLASYVSFSSWRYVQYSSRIEAATDIPPIDAYNRLRQIYLFKIFDPGLASGLFSSYWDRRAAYSGIQEDAGHALLFGLNGLEIESDSLRRQAETNSLLKAYTGLQGTFRNREGAEVSALNFSPKGNFVAIGAVDGLVQVRNAASGQVSLSRRIGDCIPEGSVAANSKMQLDPILDLSFSADEKWIGVRSASGLAQVWNVNDGKQCSQVWHDTTRLVFTTSGSNPKYYVVLVAFSNGLIQSWAGKTAAWGTTHSFPKQKLEKAAHALVRSRTNPDLRARPQPLHPASRSGGMSPATHPDLEAKTATLSSIVYASRLLPNVPDHIFAVDSQYNVIEWRHDNKTPSNTSPQSLIGSEIQPVFSPDGARMVAMKGGQLELWDLVKLKPIMRMENKADLKSVISFSPDSKAFAVYSANQIHLYQSDTGAASGVFSTPWFPANADLKLLQNQTFLIIPGVVGGTLSASANTDLKLLQYPVLWDPSRKTVTTPLPEAASIVAVSPVSHQLLTVSGEDFARLWNLDERAVHQDPFNVISLNANASMAVEQSDDGTLRVRDLRLGISPTQLNRHSLLDLAALSLDGKLLAVASGQSHLEIFFGNKKIYFKDFDQAIRSLLFSPDSRILLVQYGNSSWNMLRIKHSDVTDEGSPISEKMHFITSAPSNGSLAEFSQNGEVVLLMTSDTIDLVRCTDKQLIEHFSLPDQVKLTYAFSPDTSKLVLFEGTAIKIIDWRNNDIKPVKVESPPQFLAFEPGGNRFLAIFPNKARMWNFAASNWQVEFNTLPNSSAAYFLPESSEIDNYSYLLTLDSEARILQLWDATHGNKKGPDLKLASPVEGMVRFTFDPLRVIIPCRFGWVHKLKITSEGLRPDGSQIRLGPPEPVPNGLLEPEQIFVSVIRSGLVWQVSLTYLRDNPNPPSMLKLDQLESTRNALLKKMSIDDERNVAP